LSLCYAGISNDGDGAVILFEDDHDALLGLGQDGVNIEG
jgi:hypothetical protein